MHNTGGRAFLNLLDRDSTMYLRSSAEIHGCRSGPSAATQNQNTVHKMPSRPTKHAYIQIILKHTNNSAEQSRIVSDSVRIGILRYWICNIPLRQ